MKLNAGQKHFLRLVSRGMKDGWCPISKEVYPTFINIMPKELVEVESTDNGRGQAKLTRTGKNVLDAMEWL